MVVHHHELDFTGSSEFKIAGGCNWQSRNGNRRSLPLATGLDTHTPTHPHTHTTPHHTTPHHTTPHHTTPHHTTPHHTTPHHTNTAHAGTHTHTQARAHACTRTRTLYNQLIGARSVYNYQCSHACIDTRTHIHVTQRTDEHNRSKALHTQHDTQRPSGARRWTREAAPRCCRRDSKPLLRRPRLVPDELES